MGVLLMHSQCILSAHHHTALLLNLVHIEDCSLLKYNAMQIGKWAPLLEELAASVFRTLHSSWIILKMEAASGFITLLYMYYCVQYHFPENQTFHQQCCENVRSSIVKTFASVTLYFLLVFPKYGIVQFMLRYIDFIVILVR